MKMNIFIKFSKCLWIYFWGNLRHASLHTLPIPRLRFSLPMREVHFFLVWPKHWPSSSTVLGGYIIMTFFFYEIKFFYSRDFFSSLFLSASHIYISERVLYQHKIDSLPFKKNSFLKRRARKNNSMNFSLWIANTHSMGK